MYFSMIIVLGVAQGVAVRKYFKIIYTNFVFLIDIYTNIVYNKDNQRRTNLKKTEANKMRTYKINYREARNTNGTIYETSITAKNLKEAEKAAHEEFNEANGYTVVKVTWERF